MYIINKYWKPKRYAQAECVKKKEKHVESKKNQWNNIVNVTFVLNDQSIEFCYICLNKKLTIFRFLYFSSIKEKYNYFG